MKSYKTFIPAVAYTILRNISNVTGMSVFETLLFNAYDSLTKIGEEVMFDNAFNIAVSMLLLLLGISIAFIFLSGYFWSRERKRILLE
ncbi:MAG: hypothetical protein QXL10_01155 [Candidatus Bathyarchaeia archaeon]